MENVQLSKFCDENTGSAYESNVPSGFAYNPIHNTFAIGDSTLGNVHVFDTQTKKQQSFEASKVNRSQSQLKHAI